MLFGQSIFQSVVTRLKEEREDDDLLETGESFYVRGLTTGFVTSTADEAATIGTGTEAYFASIADLADFVPAAQPASAPTPPSAPSAPSHLTRLTEEEIAEELGISQADNEMALNEKRRKFAKANHPDSVAIEFRDKATTRMKIANLLIDRAIKNLSYR